MDRLGSVGFSVDAFFPNVVLKNSCGDDSGNAAVSVVTDVRDFFLSCILFIISFYFFLVAHFNSVFGRIFLFGTFLSSVRSFFLSSPQWGAADAEIKVPSGENTELKRSPFKAWSKSVYSHTC